MAQSSITGATVKIAPNGTADLELNIEGEELAAIAQVTLQFPDKISIEKNQKGRYKYTLGDLCSDGHSATVKDKNDGSVLVLVQNNDGDPFEDNSGLLITLPLKAADDITAGEYNVLMSGIVIGTNDSPSRKLNSVTEGTIKVVVKNQAVISVSESSILGTFGVNLTAPTATVSQGYDGTLSYKSSNEQVVNVSQNGSLTIVGVGSAVITISGSETSTWFAPADVSYSVQIDKASITPVVTLVGWTFGQTANVPSVTGNTGNGSVTYQYKVKGAADETYSTTVPTDAGNYTVKVIVEATANYKAGTATADFTIAPKDVNASMIQAIADLIYTGSALTPQITVKDGNTAMTLNSDYTVAYSNNTNAGTATVTITGKGNY
ncbi:MAG: hypothetical protein IK075_01350, partial [Prevotella sp.]|nr:hypothetical protein [Prevotella sp.]